MKPKEFLYFYRILNWNGKISGIRPIGYTFLGYIIAGQPKFPSIILNSIAIFGILSFCSALNDYYDWKILKEYNFLASKIIQGEISKEKSIFYCLLPLILCIPFLFISKTGNLHLYLFIIILLLTTMYSLPPIRIKQRKLLSFLTPSIVASILFLQGFSILDKISLDIILLAILLFLYQSYLESLHVMEDSMKEYEFKKIRDPKKIFLLLKILPILSLTFSLIFSFFNFVFITTSVFSIIRYRTIRKVSFKNIHLIRANLLSPVLSLYEFGIYSIFGILNLL